LDTSIRHLYVPETKPCSRVALAHGATIAEVMAVLQMRIAQGVQASEELARAGMAGETTA
jgi:hypothetical protein